MDRITKSLLDEFSTTAEIENLDEASRFEHFSAYLTVGKHVSEVFDTFSVVTGSGGDTGIDAIGVIINGTLVTDPDMVQELAETNGYLDVIFVFVQAERTAGFNTAKIGQFGFGVADFFKDNPALPRNELVRDLATVMSAVYSRSSKFKRRNPTCRLYYVTTGKWTGDVSLEARRTGVRDDLLALRIFQEVEFDPIDADAIQKLYGATKNAISREFVFAERTAMPEMPGVAEAYLGLIPGIEFLKLIEEDEEIIKGLFYDNVRDWQDYNPVNSEMKETLKTAAGRARFALMNNGVTLIAKTMRATGNKIYIEDYQIVNGCQTSHVLHDNKEHLDETLMVPLRIIASQDEEVISSIVKATNRQTEVKAEQLMALSDFQKKLEAFFQTFEEGKKLYYERRSRQYNDVSGIEKTRIITPANVIRAFAAMFLGEPHSTTRNYRSLLEKVGNEIFGFDDRLEPYYTVAFALYRLEYFFRNQVIEAKYKAARYHLLLASRLFIKSDPTPSSNSHAMQRYCEDLLIVFWDGGEAEEVFRKAIQVIDTVAGGNFDRDYIRTQSFTERVIQEVHRIRANETNQSSQHS